MAMDQPSYATIAIEIFLMWICRKILNTSIFQTQGKKVPFV